MNYILKYWEAIEGGKCVVSRRVRKQYAKLVEKINHPSGQFVFDEKKAVRPIEFIERFCKQSTGEWGAQPIILELFQKAFISALFGFVDRETGLRQYRETMFYVARKNGKSTMLAAIALYMLIADYEAGAEIYSVATKRDQAKIIFNETHKMIIQSAELRKLIKKRKSDLYFPATFSRFEALSKDSGSMDGLNAHCVIIDELHGIKDRNLYEVMKQSQSARRQPLLIMITTAGTVRECIFDDMYAYACNVVDDTYVDETFLPILYELDSREEWTQPEAWPKANPALGTIKKLDDLQAKINRAKNNPSDLRGLLVKDFNIRDTISTAWLNFDDLNNEETFDINRLRNCFAIGGADLSSVGDLTCATLLIVDKDTQKRFVTQMYWIPESTLEQRVNEEKLPYDKWVARDLVRLCTGNTIDYKDVTAWFVEMANSYGIFPAWVYYDNWSARYWVEEMKANGFTMEKCIQGAKTLSLPMQFMGADLQAKKINYNNHPVLKWCLSNTGIKEDRNGNIVPVKNQAAKQRIDGTASLLNAYVGLYQRYDEFLNVCKGGLTT